MSKIKRLLELQDVDIRIRDIEKELEDIPARKTFEACRLQEHRDALATSEDNLKAAQAAVQQLELEGQSIQDRIRKLRQQQLGLKTNKEFKAMEHEIESAKGSISGVEDRELELMEAVESSRGLVAESKSELGDEEAALAADVKVLDERASELQQDLDALKQERQDKATEVDSDWLVHYDRLMGRRKDRVVVPLQEGVCGGCHMKLPPAVLHATHKRTEMVCCEYCGRLLYT